MSKAIGFILVATLTLTNAFAKERKWQSEWHFGYNWQNYIDRNSFIYSGAGGEKTTFARNMTSHYWYANYKRVNRKGWSVGLGLMYGVRRYNTHTVQDMGNFDAAAASTLRGTEFTTGSQSSGPKYWAPEIQVGYRKKWKPKWVIASSISFSEKFFFDGIRHKISYAYDYQKDDGSYNYVPELVRIELKCGRPEARGRVTFPTTLHSLGCYLGLERAVGYREVKSVAMGLEVTRGIAVKRRNEIRIIESSPTIDEVLQKRVVYYDRNLSVGIRFAVILGKTQKEKKAVRRVM